MSFDKAKMLRNAEKHLAQGKVRAAIGEYKKIVENDPKDYQTMNLLGDLCVKDADKKEAVRWYTAAADYYGKQGFSQKAIAVYNKVLRLTPDSPEIALKLGQLHKQKGSYAEARVHFSNLAEFYKNQGRKADALEVWKEIAALDPYNTEIYVKIAETCIQNDQRDEAAKAYIEAGNRFEMKHNSDSAIGMFNKALEIEPANLIALNGLVKSQIKMGFADDAANTLESILEKQPHNREILYLLIDSYVECGRAEEAEKAVIKLVEQEPANYPKLLDVTQVFLKKDDLQSAARSLTMTSEHLLMGGQAEELAKWVNEILARNPEQLDALRLLVRYHGWQREEKELQSALVRLAESAKINESVEDESYALSQLILMAPQEVEYARRLQEINEIHGYPGVEDEFKDFIKPLDEVPAFENFETNDKVANGNGNYEKFAAAEAKSSGNGFENLYRADHETGFAFHTNDPDEFANSFSRIEIDKNETAATNEFEFEGNDTPLYFEENRVEENAVSNVAENFGVDNKLREEIETVEYYHSQGYNDLAVKVLSELIEKHGNLPELKTLGEKINTSETPTESVENLLSGESSSNELAEAVQPETQENISQNAEANQQNSNGDALDDFRSELGLSEGESGDEVDFDTPYQTGIVYKEMGMAEEAIREFQDAVKLVSPKDGTKRFFYCCNMLGHCFMEKGMHNISMMWFRRAMENEGLSEEELQGLRYEIANAYESGGEPQRAVELFEEIYAVNVEYRDVGQRLSQLHAHQ